jgi:membrane protein implicated in regulation of membrane protease activity
MIAYFTDHLWQIWAFVAVVGLILELTSGDFFIMCIAIGAAGAAIAAPFGNIYVQLGVFAVVTLFSLFQVRPFMLRYLHKNEVHRASNAEALIGRKGTVKDTVKAGGTGYVAIDGDLWKAVTAGMEDIPVGTPVKVLSINSTIITIEKTD